MQLIAALEDCGNARSKACRTPGELAETVFREAHARHRVVDMRVEARRDDEEVRAESLDRRGGLVLERVEVFLVA